MMRQFELVERVRSYDPDVDEDAINRAYVYGTKMHGVQKRASGDPYFSHPIEVAGILTNYKLDSASIVTALLHDVVEDTQATVEEIRELFGDEVARLVDGVTKLARIQIQNIETKQAENFRKFLLAMSEDIRALMVKLADRLHNMRTLNFIKDPAKRRTIAMETMEIYAPLAERIGMQEIKTELEDLAFAELHADARASILTRLRFLELHGGELVVKIMDELDQVLRKAGIEGYISGREKTAFSIWRKMQIKDVSFEQLSDIMAFRIIVENPADCYRVLGVVHTAYPTVPGRFKDYISTPKRNGYRSIHTSVIGPQRHRIEIQIRSHEMHETAELGVAAHWKYKSSDLFGAEGGKPVDGRQYSWLRELLDILEHAQSPQEFLEHTKLEMFQDQVFCFTPKGDLIAMPRGASPVDFAYAVHTEVGNTCVGAKVNGRIVPLRTRLQNGDQVEIVTSSAQKPQPEWESFIVTGRARAHIRRRVRTEARAEYIKLGRDMLLSAFAKEGYDLTDKGLTGVLEKLDVDSIEDVYAKVGEGRLISREVLISIYPGARTDGDDNIVNLSQARLKQAGGPIAIKGLTPGLAVHLSECCHPLPGDRIIGIISDGHGIEVHTIDCEKLEAFAETSERWVDLAWNPEKEPDVHIGRVTLVVANEPGSLGALSTAIARNMGNITNLRISNRSQDFFEMVINIEVRSVKHLTNIIAALRAMPAINSVERARR